MNFSNINDMDKTIGNIPCIVCVNRHMVQYPARLMISLVISKIEPNLGLTINKDYLFQYLIFRRNIIFAKMKKWPHIT